MMSAMYKGLVLLLAVLSLAGCGTMGGAKPDEVTVEEKGAPAEEAAAAGAEARGVAEPGAFKGDPLDDPANPLARRTIYFDFDSSTVKPEFQEIIKAHAAYLSAHPNVKVSVEGHADERGSREYNLGLGERRAQAVGRMLVFMGASSSQVDTISYGEEKPAALGHDEEAWRLNRRVELVYPGH